MLLLNVSVQSRKLCCDGEFQAFVRSHFHLVRSPSGGVIVLALHSVLLEMLVYIILIEAHPSPDLEKRHVPATHPTAQCAFCDPQQLADLGFNKVFLRVIVIVLYHAI